MIPDALSRAPVDRPVAEDLVGEGDCGSVIVSSILQPFAIQEGDYDGMLPDKHWANLVRAAEGDENYKKLRATVLAGFPPTANGTPPPARLYFNIRHDLSVVKDLALYGSRLVVCLLYTSPSPRDRG